MASLHVSAKELSCSVCCEIFKAPVFLSCGHSFCKECLQQFWRTKDTQECPVCRRRSSKFEPPPNLALQNVCELFLKQRNENCSLHREKLTLFCLEDTQPVCEECASSQQHINHTFRPISESVPACKEEHYTPLKSLQEEHKHKENSKGKDEETGQHIQNTDDLIKRTTLIKDGNPARYRLQTSTDNLNQSELYRKITYGERDKNKPHKSILLVGETGTGKTTLINVMINYMLGVKREDKVWFEITDDQSGRTQAHSQTSSITVYGFYPQQSPIHLTIIDTPGFGDTRGVDLDKEISKSLLSLSKSADGIHEIHAVCLVIKAAQNRLSDRQQYIFDAVQSLFGKDIAENIVLLFTHSDGMHPKDALTAVKEAEIKSAVNDKNESVFFLFNNRQTEPADEEYEMMQELAWNLSFQGIEKLFQFLNTKQPKSLKMTQDVLQKREQLEANISNIKLRIEMMVLKQNELKQHQEAVEKNKQRVKENKNFEYEVDVPYKEKVAIDLSKASMAMCCTVCEENCHYPGCYWVSNIWWCGVMDKQGNCTVCTNKCSYTEHAKHPKIYVTKTRKEKRTYEDLKKKYEDGMKKNNDFVFLVEKLQEELKELKKSEIELLNESFQCVETLEKIALNADSTDTLQHIDFLIEKLKENHETEKAKTLEDIKKRAEKPGALDYFKRFFKK